MSVIEFNAVEFVAVSHKQLEYSRDSHQISTELQDSYRIRKLPVGSYNNMTA